MKYSFSLTRLGFTTASTVMTSILLAYDVVLSGSPVMSFFVIPIWFLGAIVRAAIQRPGWILSTKRIFIPFIIGGIICSNAWLQNSIAQSRSDVVVQACKQYQKDKGHFPGKLEDLVPSYLPSVPWAKYCIVFGKFDYFGGSGDLRPMLMWTSLPPFGLSYYDFKDGRYGYMD
jgi:hypothetical protein